MAFSSEEAVDTSDPTENSSKASKDHRLVFVKVPRVVNPDSYLDYPPDYVVSRVLDEVKDEQGVLKYRVLFGSNYQDLLAFDRLVELSNGPEALSRYRDGENSPYSSSASDVSSVIRLSPRRGRQSLKRKRSSGSGSEKRASYSSSSEDELSFDSTRLSRHDSRRSGRSTTGRQLRRTTRRSSGFDAISLSESEEEDIRARPSRSRGKTKPARATQMSLRSAPSRRSARARAHHAIEQSDEDEEDDDEGLRILTSDVLPEKPRRTRTLRSSSPAVSDSTLRFEKSRRSAGTRQSQRSTRHQNKMEEIDIGDIYRSESDTARPTPKPQGAREVFQPLASSDPFVQRHIQQCDTCGNYGSGHQGQLIYCQGCTLAYHKTCLGNRTTREHLVTKIGYNDFVLQCRRCVSFARKKEMTAPDQGICQVCREAGLACNPFRSRKTPQQEEREREENEGEDPVVPVDQNRVNKAGNVLFRCTNCWRGFHFHHLLSRADMMDMGVDDEAIALQRFREYCRDWICRDCANMPAKVSGLVAWRSVDPDIHVDGSNHFDVNEDEKEYLVKWDDRSYFQAQWMPGAWTWGVTAPAMRKAFAKREDSTLPVMTTEQAIPEDYLRIDVILDVKFTNIVDTRAEEIDKARIREVDRALIKYKGLGYEDAVWEGVPTPEDGERWSDFVAAYDDWVMGRYIRIPKTTTLRARVDKARATDFNKLEKKKQPGNMGGESFKLMQYQIDGLNWLYYRWHQGKNAILADEMGLGKTIQIIGLLATLMEDHNCFPFLIVVPNSTCPNWRREIKRWAPSLRVVTYFGSGTSRRMAYQHELYPEGSKTLRCHVVVTSYDAAADDSCKRFLRSVPWQGLIVDEGQRLKNDRNQLYGALGALKIPYAVLLTGTPLQNNARELFNLLQFLDESFDANALDLEYAELTKENIPQLHNLIRPFFLRRTKAEVLTFLPPMGQIIVPISMSVLQRKLYMSILAKNPELLKSIFSIDRTLAKSERASLSNILMQLRKCLCHPFVYSEDIEERDLNAEASFRNLVDASSKLQFLELLLPKLRERGHRVLIFSQFLNMLDIAEDFLDGLGFRYQRLDGTMGSLQKQKRIDEFNAPNSPLFAFLLSTRAGGIGINLASADTVIILDPDFNPHQDIQALSRAHRIGQDKKVLCFQLMTQASAEEKIMQIGRRKMALDHVLIEQMDADDDGGVDVESILRHGAAEILEDTTKEIKYDDQSIARLLDRSQLEDTRAGQDQTAESQFSFARVWANDAESLMDSLNSSDDEGKAPDPSVWDKILKEREQLAAEEAARRQQALGRGKRARQTVDYAGHDRVQDTPQKNRRGLPKDSDSDTDFMAEQSNAEESGEDEPPELEQEERDEAAKGLRGQGADRPPPTFSRQPPSQPTRKPAFVPRKASTQRQGQTNDHTPATINPPTHQPPHHLPFRRATVTWPETPDAIPPLGTPEQQSNPVHLCIACNAPHRVGYCPLKLAGPEHCNLCGLAHFGVSRTCPHIRSETQVREMLVALKSSPESRVLVHEATRYLNGVKGTLAQDKRRRAEKAERARLEAEGGAVSSVGIPDGNAGAMPPSSSHSHASKLGRLNKPPGGNFADLAAQVTAAILPASARKQASPRMDGAVPRRVMQNGGATASAAGFAPGLAQQPSGVPSYH